MTRGVAQHDQQRMPVRTCRGCRQRRPAQELICIAEGTGQQPRVIGVGGVRVATAHGRGTSCCPERKCVLRVIRPWLGRAGAREGTRLAAERLEREAWGLAQCWTLRRREGLRRRRLGDEDRHVLAWQAIAGRLAASSPVTP